MRILVPVTLFGWIPIILIVFAILPHRRAVLATSIFAWLFLPLAGYKVPWLPGFRTTRPTSVFTTRQGGDQVETISNPWTGVLPSSPGNPSARVLQPAGQADAPTRTTILRDEARGHSSIDTTVTAPYRQ